MYRGSGSIGDNVNMSIISPPANAKKKIYTVTEADLAAAIVIAEFEVTLFYGHIESNSLYNGRVDLDFLKNSEVWTSIINVSAASDYKAAENTNTSAGGNWSNLFPPDNPKFPFKLRARVATKATQGTCKVTVYYL